MKNKITLLFENKKVKLGVFIISVFFVTIFLGKNLNPNINGMFNFHDETQPGRLQEFTYNLTHLQIPPRMAPHFSYNMGYPVFNYYSPFAYWIGSFIELSGFNAINALKLAFLLSIIVAFIGMFLFLNEILSFYSALAGAAFYITATYIPVDIFIRGNLSEVWFMGLFPLALYFIMKNAKDSSKITFIATTLTLSALFTVHNIFSLLSLGLVSIFILFQKDKKRNIIAMAFGLLLSSYFLIPAVIESHLTYASQVAKETHYWDHFLCYWQLWSSPWGYGGSAPGCDNDGMSFKVGKPQLIVGILGMGLFLITLLKKREKKEFLKNITLSSILLLTITSLFLTLYQSQIIWQIFGVLLALFQFPWRFILFGSFGIAVFCGYFFSKFKFFFMPVLFVLLTIGIVVINAKYFGKVLIQNDQYTNLYLSSDYIYSTIAYKIPEYLPRTASYQYWQKIQKNPRLALTFNPSKPSLTEETNKNEVMTIKNESYNKELNVIKPSSFAINIHYFPYWQFTLDGKKYIPKTFDKLGRPIFKNQLPATITITYRQTLLEKLANMLSLVSLGVLILFVFYSPLWKKMTRRNT